MSSNTPNHDAQPGYIQLTFVLNETSRELSAQLESADAAMSADLKSLRQSLHTEGYENIDVDDVTLLDVLRKIRKGETGTVVLGMQQPSAKIDFDFDDKSNELFAVLTLEDNAPGVTLKILKERLDNAGYSNFNIQESTLADITRKANQKQAGRYLLGKKPEYTLITYELEEETGNLFAELSLADHEIRHDREGVMEELKQLGYEQCHFEPGILDKLPMQANQGERGRYLIGQKRNALITIDYDAEFMNAYMSVAPPQGGKELDRELLEQALVDEDVAKECCNEKVLESIIKSKTASNVLFAQGREPVDGIDASFEALVQEVEYSTPKESKTGKIDLREIVNFTLIEAGVQLMRRTPAKLGINGLNVKGHAIPAVEALETPFCEELTGAQVSPEDENLLVSTCKGHPVILKDGVRVDNTILVNNVDMSTGNITYDGSVMVKGEVRPGMKIKVTGDIIIKGVVTKAHLQAKNNITVECGIIGSDPAKDGEQSPPAIIKAGGNIQAQYINLADVHAGNDVVVREYISHCTTEAKNQILIGQNGGKGRVFGGTCYGRSGIYANAIGASGDIKTQLSAGTPVQQQKQFEQLNKSYKNRQAQAKQLTGILKKYTETIKANPQDIEKIQKASAIQKVLNDLQQEIEKMSMTINQISRMFHQAKKAEVSVRKETFPNVTILINGAEFHIRQESKGGIFVKQGQDIRWQNYKAK